MRGTAVVDDRSDASGIIIRVVIESGSRGMVAGEEIRSRERIYMVSVVKVRIMLVTSAHQSLYFGVC